VGRFFWLAMHESPPLGLEAQVGTWSQLPARVGTKPSLSSFSTNPFGSDERKSIVTVPRASPVIVVNSTKTTLCEKLEGRRRWSGSRSTPALAGVHGKFAEEAFPTTAVMIWEIVDPRTSGV